MLTSQSRVRNIIFLLAITFLDILALSVFFGTSIPLILAPDNVLGVLNQRELVYGFSLAILPIGQFLFGPIWGQLADQYGRKIILKLTLSLSALGYVLMALAIDEKIFYLFLVGRAATACVAINGALAQASMADFSQGVRKTQRFNLQFITISLGFILGPYFISGTTHNILFSHVYWALAIGYALLVVLMYLLFAETLPHAVIASDAWQFGKIKWTRNFEQIMLLFKEKALRKILGFWCAFQIGWSLFFQYSGEFLYTGRHLPNEAINQLFSWVGLGVLACQILFVYPLAKKVLPQRVVPWSIFLVGSSLMLGGIVPMGVWFYAMLAIYCIGISFFLTNFNVYVSNLAPATQQGRLMTMLAAGQAAMTIVVTLVGNFIATKYLATPYVIGGLIILTSTIFWVRKP